MSKSSPSEMNGVENGHQVEKPPALEEEIDEDDRKYVEEIRSFVPSERLLALAKIWPFRYLGLFARERDGGCQTPLLSFSSF